MLIRFAHTGQTSNSSMNLFRENEDGNGGDANDNKNEANEEDKNEGKEADKAAGKDADGKGDKKFTDDETAALLKDVMRHKKKNESLAAEKAALAEKLKAFDGIDVDEVRKLLEDKKKNEEENLKAAGDFEALKKRMQEAHVADLGKKDTIIEETKSQLSKLMNTVVELTVGNAFATSKFITEDTVLTPRKARTIYGSYFELDENNTMVGYNKPAGAEGREPLVNGAGDPLSFDEAMKKIIEEDEDKDALLRAKGKTGAGAVDAGLKKKQTEERVTGLAAISKGLEEKFKGKKK